MLGFFALYLSAWCDPATGKPRSWRHFYYGLQILYRERARDTERLFVAQAHAFGSMKNTQQWLDLVNTAAGWHDQLPADPGAEDDHG